MSTRMSQEMPRPWRKTLDWSDTNKASEELYNNLENYSPTSDSIDGISITNAANILLFGPVGAGKSSFINTVASIFRRKMTLQTRCGNASRSLTTKLRRYHVVSDSGKSLNFNLYDMMGLEKDHPVTETNMQLLLEGALKDNSHYDFSSRFSKYGQGFNNSLTLDNKIHCVAIFFDATVVDCMTESMPEVVQNIKDLQILMNRLDVPQVIILTKIDNVCAKTKDDLSFVYRSERVKECVSRVSDILGLPRNAIFPVKNYEDEGQLSSNVNILTMYTLTKILEQVDAALLNRVEEIKTNRHRAENEFINVINYIIDLFRWIWPSR